MSSHTQQPSSRASVPAVSPHPGIQERRPGARLLRAPDVSGDALLDAVARHDALVAGAEADARPGAASGVGSVLKRDHRARVTALCGSPLGSVCVKEFVRPRWRDRLIDGLTGSRARAAWCGAALCAAHGVPAPRPLGVVERPGHSYFVSELLEDAVPLQEYASARARPADPNARRRWRTFVSTLARFVRYLHDQPLHHRDLAPKNLLVREREDGWEIFVLDLSDVRPGRPRRRMRIRNLVQLGHLHVSPSATDRLRFFREYASGRPEQHDRALLRTLEQRARARRARWAARRGAAGTAVAPGARRRD